MQKKLLLFLTLKLSNMEQKTALQQSCIEFAANPIAANLRWEDCTTYSRNDKERIPTTFDVGVDGVRVVITCGHTHHRPAWVFHCYLIGFDTCFLGAGMTAKEAAEMAIAMCRKRVQRLHDSFFETDIDEVDKL